MRFVFAALALCMAGCGPIQRGYPPQYELNFMRSCQAAGTSAEVCGCTWAKIEENVPRAEFDRFERLPAAERPASPLQRQLISYAIECAAPPKP
jgi:hypothetical protein